MSGFNRIGEILIARGLVTKQQLVDALEDRNQSYFRIGEILVAKGCVTEDDILDCLAEQYNFPIVDLHRTRPSVDAMSLIPIEKLDSSPMIPIYQHGKNLICAVPGPFDTSFYHSVEQQYLVNIEFVLARTQDIRKALCDYVERTKGSSFVEHSFIEPPITSELRRQERKD